MKGRVGAIQSWLDRGQVLSLTSAEMPFSKLGLMKLSLNQVAEDYSNNKYDIMNYDTAKVIHDKPMI